jgi:hypothetical protein
LPCAGGAGDAFGGGVAGGGLGGGVAGGADGDSEPGWAGVAVFAGRLIDSNAVLSFYRLIFVDSPAGYPIGRG